MKRECIRIPSPTIGGEMEILVFGTTGKPMIVFPSQEGRFFDYENFGMIDTVADFINEGKIKVYCVDSIDHQSWFSQQHPIEKARRANDYDWAIANEILPALRTDFHTPETGFIAHGCSFGAYHTVNFYLRHPDLFDIGIALSGTYSIAFTCDGFCNEDVYYNDPLLYVPNLTEPWYVDHLRNNILLICSGQGAWEDWQDEAKELAHWLRHRGIPHRLDLWGHDVNHDWPWWKKQIVYFLKKLDTAGLLGDHARVTRDETQNFLQNFSSF